MALTKERIKEKLTEKFGEQLTDWQEPYGLLTCTAPKDFNLKVLQFLFDDDELQFRFLSDLQAVHYPDNAGAEPVSYTHLDVYKRQA